MDILYKYIKNNVYQTRHNSKEYKIKRNCDDYYIHIRGYALQC